MNEILSKLKTNNLISFQEIIDYIDKNYHFTPTAFKNGNQYNEAGQNNGSCKIFAFANMNNVTKEDTLLLFCEHYEAVLGTPEGSDHQNIRNFIIFGWEQVFFEGNVLRKK